MFFVKSMYKKKIVIFSTLNKRKRGQRKLEICNVNLTSVTGLGLTKSVINYEAA
jgi:hypothetical protein